ncbi:MAG: Ppx/GppA family phosphatase [Fibrobacteres bacterium]|nr:Ppx/GppA family phosphatase [Fibrobacterota bacterium]
MLIRIVDIGSNSIKASVYDVQNQDHKVADKAKLSFSLGEEVFSSGSAGSISESSQDKVAAFIQGLPVSVNGEKVHFTFVMATSAVRSAKNRDAFARRLQQKTGFVLRLLSGEEESFLIHMGIASKSGIGPQEVINTIDIGGGSAEISWSRGYDYLFGHSYDLGAIRLSQRFLKGKAFSREALEQIQELAESEFKTRFKGDAPPLCQRAFGSSGNIRAIARMVEGVRGGPFVKLIPEITVGSLEDIAEISLGKSAQNIQSLFDITLERARIIMPAVVVLSASMRAFGIHRLAISEAGLREGAAYFWSRHGHLNLPVDGAVPAA